MIIRFTTLTVTILLGIAMNLVHAETVEVPPGVHYKAVDEPTDLKARKLVQDAFASGAPRVTAILSDAVICAPAYWSMIKDDAAIKAASTIPSKFRLPIGSTGQVQVLDGATFKDPASRQALAVRLAADFGQTPSIRKLRADELSLYWAIVPFDIEEPVYILESDGKRFLINLTPHKERLSIMWVDEISSYKTGK